MAKKEKAVGVVFVLDCAKTRIMFPPEGALPIGLEIVGFPDIGGRLRRELEELIHRRRHRAGARLRLGFIGLVTGDAWIGGRRVRRTDRQRKGLDDLRVNRSLPRRRNRLWPCPGQPFVEMQGHVVLLRRGDQGVRETVAMIVFEERRRQPGRLIGIYDLPGLADISRPGDVAGRSARAIIGDDEAGSLPEKRSCSPQLGLKRASR